MQPEYIQLDDGIYRILDPTYYNGFEIGVILESTDHLYQGDDDY
jgi:hypothetical protein